MRISLITGSRADRAALEAVQEALKPSHPVLFDLDDISAWRNWTPIWRVGRAVERMQHAVFGETGDQPDLVVIHGDRHEIAGAALAANVMGIPMAHIGGGDLTEGSQDDCFRHAITKLSHLHFATNADSAARIVKMGEHPDRVHTVGDPGIDSILATQIMRRDETFVAVGLKSCERALLVCLHPNTLGSVGAELKPLHDALMVVADQHHDVGLVFIGPNADAGGDIIRKQWNSIVAEMPQRAVYHENLPRPAYLSLMRWCDAMVGNSSAGFHEAPCFGTPVVNIGDRQKGRPKAGNIHDVPPDAGWVLGGIRSALRDWSVPEYRTALKNSYGDGHAAQRIAKIIGEIKDPKALLRKRFQTCGMKACPLDGVTS